MDHPAISSPTGPLSFSGSSQQPGKLAAAYRALPRRRLVITGGPGTGKTTLALQLLMELLPPPGEAPSEPVPVLLSVHSWDPSTHPRIQDWLAIQLMHTYPALGAISPDAAAALAAQDRTLPILDGLDEVPEERRAAILAALNNSLSGGLILTSRRAEYRTALVAVGDVITASVTIAPLALTSADASQYLRAQLPPSCNPAWNSVLSHINPTAPLARVTATPLGLWLVRAVYVDGHRDPTPLNDGTFPTFASLHAHLLDELIPALLAARPPLTRRRRNSPAYPHRPRRMHRPQDVRRWLTTVARYMREQGGRDFNWWELARHTFPTRRERFLVRAMVFFLMSVFAYLAWMPPSGRVFMSSFLLGLLTSAAIMFEATPAHVNLRALRRPSILALALAGGATLALISWALLPLVPMPGSRRAFIIAGFTYGSVLVAAIAVKSDDIAAKALSPTRSLVGDRLSMATVATVLAISVGAYLWLNTSPAKSLATATLTALGIACIGNATAPFYFACTKEAPTKRLPIPWRVMPMLEDCHQLGLLRTVGPTYQFRHAELQDHLAPPPPK
ncbi:NACHT domain-containing protein [Geodermatophilus sp. SYSU D00758]